MPQYQVDFSTASILDLKEITEYLDGQRPGLGFEFSFEITLLLERLETNPYIFQKIDDSVRRGLLGKFNYLIFYKIDSSIITVIGIEHSSRKPRF